MPGAADAALHLVDDQQRAGGVADRAHRGEETGRRRHDPALAQRRLDEDGRGRLVDRGAQRVDVAEVDERDRSGQRLRTARAWRRCR